ncbi:MAG: hypothetical protein NT150_03545 [Bacteroidetes bacterium]|nr:hypothetical protein [Bacteroidota bacterium]
MKRTKRTYDTNLIYLALYDDNSKKQILQLVPSSTFYSWRDKGGEHFYGKEFASHNHSSAIDIAKKLARSQRLIQAAKGLYHLYSSYKSIIDNLPDVKKLYRDNKKLILKSFHSATLYLSKSKIYKTLNVSHDFIHFKHIPACFNSLLNKCLKKHPLQLTASDLKIIHEYCLHPIYKSWQGISVYWQMIRDKKLFCSKTTFYRYINKMGISFPKKRNVWKNYTPIIANKPFEILHMDVSKIVLNNLKGYLYLIIDNFSRCILSYEFSKEIKSFISTKNLIKVCWKFNLQVNPAVTLITDGGSENKGYVNRLINLPCINIVKKIAQTDISSSNSMVESVIKQLKQYHLQLNPDDDFEKVSKAIDIGISQYTDKPLDIHNGFSPNEALSLSPDFLNKKPFFSQDEKISMRNNRRKINQINRCGTCK